MDSQSILHSAKEIANDIIAHRRAIHKTPEVGSHLPYTVAYVKKQLTKMGYEPAELGGGIVATITGRDTGRCILLRADMDGLAIKEETQLEYKSCNGNMHACGHDMHTAMLLGAAALLQKFQSELHGTVKLIFQPDEEGFTGAKSMLSAGALKNPTPQAGLALHVHSGTPSGLVLCGKGTLMPGSTFFRITVTGVGCHGAMPETGIDPINAATNIYNALQTIISREIAPKEPLAFTIGSFHAGEGANIIPQKAVLEGTFRSFRKEISDMVVERIRDISEQVAAGLRCCCVTEIFTSTPPMENNPELVEQMATCAESLFGKESAFRISEGSMGADDFAFFTQEFPCAYLLLGAGTKKENPLFGKPMHNAQVVFNEEVLPLGAALETYCAIKWLKRQAP